MYKINTEELIYSKNKLGHQDDPIFNIFLGEKDILRGRVSNYEGSTFIILYLNPKRSTINTINDYIVLDVKNKIQTVSRETIMYIFDDFGNILFESLN